MPKRSAEDKIRKYFKKIKRLEKQQRFSSESLNVSDADSDAGNNMAGTSQGEFHIPPLSPPPTPPPPESESVEPELALLEPEILGALGDETDEGPKFGGKIHQNLADRWLPILRKGLAKEEKDAITKQYLIPENCMLLQAPTLNMEISAAITDMARHRDKKLESAQQVLGVGVSAINKALTILITGQDKVQAIKGLSDGCRILTDLHFRETQARIKLISPGLSKPFLNIIQECERDETLFGNKLSEQIKASKAIEKQSSQIKKPIIPQPMPKARMQPATSNLSYRGNYQGPSRYPMNRGVRGGQRKVPYQRRAPPPTMRPGSLNKPHHATSQQ